MRPVVCTTAVTAEETSIRRDRAWSIACGALFLVLMLAFSAFVGNDDAYITFWAAHILAKHGTLVNLNGVRIEQSSSLAMVVVLALFERLLPWISLPMLGWCVSIGAGLACIAASVRLARLIEPGVARYAAPIVATTTSFFYWSGTGMETSLAALAYLLVALAVVRFVASWNARNGLLVAGAMVLAAAARPEAPIVLACALFGLNVACALRWLRPGERAPARALLARTGVALAIGAAAISVPLLFRLAWFHQLFPRPVWVKAGGPMRWRDGLNYLATSVEQSNPALFGAALVSIGVAAWHSVFRRWDTAWIIAATLTAAGLCFVVASGGDWMAMGRFAVPVIPLMAVLSVALAATGATTPARAAAVLASALVAGNLLECYPLARGRAGAQSLRAALTQYHLFREKVDPHAYSLLGLGAGHIRDAFVLQKLLPIVDGAVHKRHGPLYLMSGQAGMVPFYVFSRYFGRVRFIDLWSITTRNLDHCLPRSTNRHTRIGIPVPIAWFFAHADEIRRRCGVPKPAVIFNTGVPSGTLAALRRWGYTIAYTQRGDMARISDPHPRRRGVSMAYYIAVQTDLWKKLGKVPTSYDVDELSR